MTVRRTTSSRLAILAGLLFLIPILGCASSRDTLADAREALRNGQYERAVVLFDAVRRSGGLDPLTKEEADLARRRAVDGRLERARAEEYQGDFSGALAELRAAEEFAPGDERIEQEIRRISREQERVQQDLAKARELLSEGRARQAHNLLEPLGGKGRVSADYDSLLRQSQQAAEAQTTAAQATDRRRRIQAALAAAEEDWRRGDHGAALEAIDRGRRELGDDPAFEAQARPWRDAVRKHFLALAAEQSAGGREATALLLAMAALAADPDHRDARIGVERYRLSAGPALTERVRVTEFGDETGGRVDPLRFQQKLVAALSHPFTEFTASSGGQVELAVYGRIKALTVTSAEPRSENRVQDYLVRTDQEINPERAAAERRLTAAQERLADRQSVYEPVKRELEELEMLEGSPLIQPNGGRQYGPYSEAAYFRILAGGRARATQARRSVEAAEQEVDAAGKQLDRTPYYLDKKIIGRVPYTVRTITKSASASAFYAVSAAGRETEEPSRSGTETVSLTVSDSTHEGLPSANLAPDPIELPGDVELGELAISDLAARLARRIEMGIDQKRLALLEAGRALMRNGDEAGALDRYAAFLLTTGEGLALERATAARPIRSAFGVEVTADRVGLSGLRIEELESD